MKMTKEEAIQELIDASQEEAKYGDNFAEVVNFFNDIMESFHEDLKLFSVSTESVRYARNRVYDVFSRRYKIKEIERKNGESEVIQEV